MEQSKIKFEVIFHPFLRNLISKKLGSLGGKMKLPPTHCSGFIFFGMVSLTLIVWALLYYF